VRTSVSGHSIPKAESSQRTPRACSAEYASDIWYSTSVSSSSVWNPCAMPVGTNSILPFAAESSTPYHRQ